MEEIRIALLQILPGKSTEENLKIGDCACRAAKEKGADIALFPEMWSCGYDFTEKNASEKAIDRDGTFIRHFACLAKEIHMAIGISYLEKFDPAPRNSFALFDENGSRVLDYAKVHTCDFGEEKALSPGNAFPVGSLFIRGEEIKVGAMICYDREFPESARILMLHGAEIILVPNACPMGINRLAQLRARAFENMLCICTANYPAPQPDCDGHSSVFDGIVYADDCDGERDICLLQAGEEEGIFLCEIPIKKLRAYRKNEVHGNAYRKPKRYAELIREEVNAPFLRPDARR